MVAEAAIYTTATLGEQALDAACPYAADNGTPIMGGVRSIARMLRSIVALAVVSVAACAGPTDTGPPWFNDGGTPYCWNYACPSDPDASVCGTCKDHDDRTCPPGFVCSCSGDCVKGPRSYDGGICPIDAAGPPTPDATVYEWPACDERHPPGT